MADLEVGDVITYRDPSSSSRDLVTRRIADIRAGVIWTRSDRTGVIDPWTLTPQQSTQARAVVDVPYVGFAYDALASGARRLWLRFSRLP